MNATSALTSLVDPEAVVRNQGPPYDLFAKWRQSDPVHWQAPPTPGEYPDPQPGMGLNRGFWVLTRHRDVHAVSGDQATFTSHDGSAVIWDYAAERLAAQQAGIMAMPPAMHTRVKRLLLPPFAPAALQAFEPEIAHRARQIVDDVAQRGRCEFVFDVASRLPVHTFCTLMGIPHDDWDTIFRLGNATADIERWRERERDPTEELFEYAGRIAAAKRANPDGSMMSAYVSGVVDGDRLNDAQIAMFFVTMAIAGHETTRTTATHFLRLMDAHPEQRALLLSDLDRFLPNAIEEVLRFAPPVINFRRTATRDVEIGGTSIARGDKLYLSYASANRDPEVFEDPERFDITRVNASKHLSFGYGQHVCLGARLARMQLRILLREIYTRLPDIRLAGPTKILPSIWFNAVIDMPVEFTPEHAQ